MKLAVSSLSPTVGAVRSNRARVLDAARDGGLTLREAVKPLAKHLGASASEIYRLAAER